MVDNACLYHYYLLHNVIVQADGQFLSLIYIFHTTPLSLPMGRQGGTHRHATSLYNTDDWERTGRHEQNQIVHQHVSSGVTVRSVSFVNRQSPREWRRVQRNGGEKKMRMKNYRFINRQLRPHLGGQAYT